MKQAIIFFAILFCISFVPTSKADLYTESTSISTEKPCFHVEVLTCNFEPCPSGSIFGSSFYGTAKVTLDNGDSKIYDYWFDCDGTIHYDPRGALSPEQEEMFDQVIWNLYYSSL